MAACEGGEGGSVQHRIQNTKHKQNKILNTNTKWRVAACEGGDGGGVKHEI